MAHILIVDDSATVVHFARQLLQGEGHVVEALKSFVNLAMLVSTTPPDLILLDLDMPAISGMTAGRLIRKYETRKIPVIIYSSRPTADREEAAREIGAIATLVKNGSPKDLLDVVELALAASVRRTG